MVKLLISFVLFDIAPPEPFKFGASGKASAVAFGLFLSAIAIAGFLLLRRKLSLIVRAVIAGAILLLGFGCTIFIWTAAAAYDAEAERNRPRYERPYNPARERQENDEIKMETANSNTNKAPKSNIKSH